MYAVVRIRGSIGVKKEILNAMELMRIHRVNHLVLVREDASGKGSVGKVRDYVAFGEIDEKTLAQVIEKRGKTVGDKKIDLKKMKASEVAKEIISGKKKLQDFGIKPVFRLSPPKKGFERKGIKKSFQEGGAIGYRGKEINALIKKMM